MVGYTMICFGLTGAASSYMSGKLIRYTGRIAVYVTGGYFYLSMYRLMDAYLNYFTRPDYVTRHVLTDVFRLNIIQNCKNFRFRRLWRLKVVALTCIDLVTINRNSK